MIGNSLYPLSNKPRRSSRASTLKSSRPNPRLIATSHKLAALREARCPDCRSRFGLVLKVAWVHRRPTEEDAYPAAVSCTTAEDALDLLLAHAVKVVRHRDLPRHETEPPYLSTSGSAKGSDFHDGLTGLGNDERLTL